MNCTACSLLRYGIGTFMSKSTDFQFSMCSSFGIIELVTNYKKSYQIVFEITAKKCIVNSDVGIRQRKILEGFKSV